MLILNSQRNGKSRLRKNCLIPVRKTNLLKGSLVKKQLILIIEKKINLRLIGGKFYNAQKRKQIAKKNWEIFLIFWRTSGSHSR